MKNTIYTISTLILLMLIFACSSDNNNVEQNTSINLTSNIWEVIKIKKQGEIIYLNADKGYTIEFKNDNIYTLNISPNVCTGNYVISENMHITITPTGCTQLAGQTEFASDLSNLFPKMTKYSKNDNELTFEGQGEIILNSL